MRKIMLYIMLYAVFVLPIFNVYAEESMDKEGDNGVSEEENIEEDDSEEDDSLSLASNAKSAIIIEASTGKVIFEKNANEKLAMASMTKMMSLLLIMENIENGNLTWDEMITTSENAASMGGSQIFLQVGEQMSVEDMVKGICIASGNDVAVMKKQS